jgi:hypothetical protein
VETAKTSAVAKPAVKAEKKADFAALRTLLELAISDINCGRAMAELIPPEIIPGDTPLEKALNLALNAALNDEMDDLHDQLQNLLIEHPSPTVSRAIFQPTVFPAARRERALNDAVSELLKCRRRKDEGELLAKMRNAATPEERMKFLIELQNANKSQMEVNL